MTFPFTASCPGSSIGPKACDGVLLLWTATEEPVLRDALYGRNGCTQISSPFSCCIGFSWTDHSEVLCNGVDFPAFPRLFSPGAGSNFGRWWPGRGARDQENSGPRASHFFPVFCWCAVGTGIAHSACGQNHRVPLSHGSVSRMEMLLLLYLNIPVHIWGRCMSCAPIPSPGAGPFWCSLLPPGFHLISFLVFPSPAQLPAPQERLPVSSSWKAAPCFRELQELPKSWAVKLCCFKVTLTWVLQQTCIASAAVVSHEGAAVKY